MTYSTFSLTAYPFFLRNYVCKMRIVVCIVVCILPVHVFADPQVRILHPAILLSVNLRPPYKKLVQVYIYHKSLNRSLFYILLVQPSQTPDCNRGPVLLVQSSQTRACNWGLASIQGPASISTRVRTIPLMATIPDTRYQRPIDTVTRYRYWKWRHRRALFECQQCS